MPTIPYTYWLLVGITLIATKIAMGTRVSYPRPRVPDSKKIIFYYSSTRDFSTTYFYGCVMIP